jgi:hypothetical protein
VGYLYTAFVIGVSIAIKNMLDAQWDRFKEREAQKTQPMELRKGVYVPWGRVQKIQRFGHFMLAFWVAYIVILIALVIYSKLIVGHPLL